MDSLHPSLPVQRPDVRHAYTQLQSTLAPPSSAPIHLREKSARESSPPSKRRRSNPANPSVLDTAEPTDLSPVTRWQSQYSQPLQSVEQTTESYIPRSLPPDQTSRVSASSNTLNGPQLRKKPKSGSIKNKHLLRITSSSTTEPLNPAASQSPVQPDTNTAPPADSPSPSTGPPLSRNNSQHQSPNQKRPPASHSSYGVETICGPPPSYSTQRTFSQERIRKLDRNTQTRMQSTSSDSLQPATPDETPAAYVHKEELAPSVVQSSPDTADTSSIPTPTETESMANVRVRGEQRLSMDEDTKASSSDERKSEDLFLNIARSDSTRTSQPKTEKRRSRVSIPFLPNNRLSQITRSSPTQPQFDSNSVTLSGVNAQPLHNKRASIGGYNPIAHSSRTYLAEIDRVREQPTDRLSDYERNNSSHVGSGHRRSPTINTESTMLAHRSSTGLRNSKLVLDNLHSEQAKVGEQVATESTISTTAPSTVWDELDDLKSRIRKLELTGKLPSSSAAAMSSTERPRTATTAATTMSTSPKHKTSETNHQSAIEGASSNVHSLLHEALDNARAVLSNEVYQKLQATTQDALQLAAMMNTEQTTNRSYATPLNNERQIRKRTESMCRGLTELAIALSAEAKPLQSTGRPVSRDQSLPPNSMLRSRRYSNDTAERTHNPTRVQSRLDSRRISVHLGRSGAGYTSPEHGSYQSLASNSHLPDSRLNRSSTLLRKRGQGSFDGTNEQFDVSPSVRPSSRAVTELGAYRRTSRDYLQSPREHLSQHQLSTQHAFTANSTTNSTPLPPSHSMNFTSRRKYASPASVVGIQDTNPVTPHEARGRSSTMLLDIQSPDVISEAGGPGRAGSSRRSLGLASRIGSSVGSRLRAARAERDTRENMIIRDGVDMIPYSHSNHTTATADVNMHRREGA